MKWRLYRCYLGGVETLSGVELGGVATGAGVLTFGIDPELEVVGVGVEVGVVFSKLTVG